jgi:hypothetical protein
MAIDQTHVYVVDHDDAIRRVPIAGGPVTTVADNLPFLSDLTTDGTHVYFSENDTGAIRKVPVAGGPIADLVSLFGFTWRMLAVSQGSVYWIDQEDVGRVPTSGGAPQYLLEDVFSDVFVPNAIVAHGPNVFFTEVAGGLVTGAYSVLPTPTTLSVADCAAVEGNAGVTTCGFRVTLTAPTSVAVAARYQVTGGTASAGDDYVAAEGTVMVPAGATEITLPVGIAGDTIQEANETFALTLGSAVNAALGDGQATGTIQDDEASGFHTVEPCRVVDTRLPVGPAGGPSVATGAVRVFPAAGACGIPADAGAIAVNVTVVRPSGQGFLVLFPADAALPVASTINFRAGAVRGNNAVVTLGTDGQLAVRCAMFTAGTTDVVIDVFGYFR